MVAVLVQSRGPLKKLVLSSPVPRDKGDGTALDLLVHGVNLCKMNHSYGDDNSIA